MRPLPYRRGAQCDDLPALPAEGAQGDDAIEEAVSGGFEGSDAAAHHPVEPRLPELVAIPSVPKTGQVNLMWIISHPDDVSPAECERFNAVFVPSETFADELRAKASVPIHVVPQAADDGRFQPIHAPENGRVVFVGNSRSVRRPMVDWAIEAGLDLEVYGSGWRGFIPDRFIRSEYFPNEEIPRLYTDAAIVLSDHWPDMAKKGFVSNRIFDALASGAFVISDPVDGLDLLFRDAVPTCSSAGDLRRLAERYLPDPVARGEKARHGQELVMQNHTFAQRAIEIANIIAPALEEKQSKRIPR